MSNERNNSAFWKNVLTGVGIAAAGASLAYFVNEIFKEEEAARERGLRSEGYERRGRRGESSSSELRDRIIDKLHSGTYECNICLEDISKENKVVSCKQCYTINHLKCIQRHCAASTASGKDLECPSCRSPITYELQYYCFCGMELNPKPREGGTPHSCQSRCTNDKCSLRCHPGPCRESI